MNPVSCDHTNDHKNKGRSTVTKPKKVTDAWLRNLKYRPLESKGLKVDGAISKRTGKPIESRPGQLLPNRYPDERGMYVNVAPTGRVTFRYSYRWPKTAQGRRQLVTYGDYPILSLEKARDQHIDFQRKLRDGINRLRKDGSSASRSRHPPISGLWPCAGTRRISRQSPTRGRKQTPDTLNGLIRTSGRETFGN